MDLTHELINAIIVACNEAGSQRTLAMRCGVPQQNLSRYIAGSVSSITSPNLAKLWPFIRDHIPAERRDAIGVSVVAENIANHRTGDFERAYTVLQMMMRSVCEIGADELFMQIIMYWPGMDEEKRKAAYIAVRNIAEKPTEEEPKP